MNILVVILIVKFLLLVGVASTMAACMLAALGARAAYSC